MATTRLGLTATPQSNGGRTSFVTKYYAQITRLGLMGVPMGQYGSFSEKYSSTAFKVYLLSRSNSSIGLR